MPNAEAADDTAVLADLNEYLSTGMSKVRGWCEPHLWQTIWPLRRLVGAAPVGEIGVYEAKFLIGLAKTFRSPIGHAGIDLFDVSEGGVGKPAIGNLATAKHNLAAHNVDNVRLLQRDSLSLGDQDVANFWNAYGGFGFFSVDGAHSAVHTVNDVTFAMRVTRPTGVIAVDDYLHPQWPGVGEGIARLYLLGSPTFVPFAYSVNKLFLCSYGRHARALELVERYVRNLNRAHVKRVPRFGFDTLFIAPHLNEAATLPLPKAQRQDA